MIKPENPPLPFYTESLLTHFPEKMPIGPFPHTNLSGTEGKPTNSLTQREAEKAISLLMGFEQTPEWIKVEKGYIETVNDVPTITLVNRTDNSCFDGDCFIKETLESSKFMVGIRITPLGNSNSPLIPFVRIAHYEDPQLIKNKMGHMIGLRLFKKGNGNTATQYSFKEGDSVELFVDPKSIKRKMDIPIKQDGNLPDKIVNETIALGGGFIMLLECMDPISQEISTTIEATSNDVVIRDIDKPENNKYKFKLPFNLQLDPEKGLVPSYKRKSNTTNDWIDQGYLPKYIDHVVTSFVENNGKALQEMAAIALTLNPSIGIHAIKCHYATVLDEAGNPSVKTYAFNLESAEAAEQWLASYDGNDIPKKPEYTRYPTTNNRLRELINQKQAVWKEPDLIQRFHAIHAALMGIIPSCLEATVKYFEEIKPINETMNKFMQESAALQQNFNTLIENNTQKTFMPKIFEADTNENPEEKSTLQSINEYLPWNMQLETNPDLSHGYSPGRILGSILAQSKYTEGSINWKAITQESNETGSITTIVSSQNPKKYLINLDIAGFNYALPIENFTIPKEFNNHESNFFDSVKVAEKLIKDWRLPITLTKAQIHSLREGD